jgi:hypothetical protein
MIAPSAALAVALASTACGGGGGTPAAAPPGSSTASGTQTASPLAAADKAASRFLQHAGVGATDADIAATAGADTLEAWNRRCVWPAGQGWSPDPETLERGAGELTRELAAGDGRIVPVLCSSQGILRYFAKLDADWFAAAVAGAKLGVATGACCGITLASPSSVRVDFWNRKPEAALLRDWRAA